MLSCQNLTYQYPGADRDSVSEVSLSFSPGERVAIVGPNGSGKSTLARLLAGLLAPGSGRIERDSRAGMLFQNPDNQMVSLIVEKEVAFSLENRGMPMREMEPVVRDTLDAFGITHLTQRLTTELSGGEKQRVSLASLMVDRPRVLILDEPDSYLDQPGRETLRTELEKLHRELPELIEIRITQYPSVAQQYPRLIEIVEGRVVFDGQPYNGLGRAPGGGESTRIQAETPGVVAGEASSLVACNINFGYNTRPLFDGARLELRTGERAVLAGPTGSGKSTLALILVGLISPVSGTVDGKSHSARTNRSSPKVGLVLQQPERQFFLPTCAEEVAFGPKNHGRELTNGEIDEVMNTVGLDPGRFRARDPYTLSVGEKRRLAFAVMLALSPTFLIFDEPTAGLDLEGIEQFKRLSARLAAAGHGLLVISHEGDLIQSVADRVLFLPGDGSLEEHSVDHFLADARFRGLVAPVSAG